MKDESFLVFVNDSSKMFFDIIDQVSRPYGAQGVGVEVTKKAYTEDA